MNIDDFRDQLAELAGPEVRSTAQARDGVRARVRRTRRRQRATAALATVLAAALVVGIVAVGIRGSNDGAPLVRTTSPTTVALDAQCRLGVPSVPAKDVPAQVAAWADRQPVVGGDELWTTRQSIASAAIHDGSISRLKIGWYTTPFGMPLINARRLDGPGTAPGLVNEATDQHGKWVASTIDLPSAGCWEITASFDRSKITFRRLIGNPTVPLAIGTITGHLVGAFGLTSSRDLRGTITVMTPDSRETVWTGDTDAAGVFTTALPPGRYRVNATSPQFNRGEATCDDPDTVVVRRGQTTRITVTCEGL